MNGRGLLARFLYAVPNSKVGSRSADPHPVPENIRAAYNRRVASIADAAHLLAEPAQLGVTDDARRLLHGLMTDFEPTLAPEGDNAAIGYWAGKWIGSIMRIAALLHLADAEGHPTTISATQLRRAITIGRYYLDHAHHAYARMAPTPIDAMAAKVLRSIRKHSDTTISQRDLKQRFRIRDTEVDRIQELTDALALLTANHYLRHIPVPHTTGRLPSPTYRINPATGGDQPFDDSDE